MSMNAMFVQVEDAEIARFEADPDSVEALFANQTLPTTGLLNMAAAMQERLRAIGPGRWQRSFRACQTRSGSRSKEAWTAQPQRWHRAGAATTS
jgi:hypothetical protein